ncbi:DNA polymerase III subunit delta' [Sulfuricella denitrificans skB26]|uniref:DNA polymerase III subunit delta' n=1 Tax=Sulfuricella denitrificans (strain DSM 22764 / NBRC 105220 / skB26) TaxID=1163617 RepID=S6AC79_SULDS|nr:DNA polymerase III subunit delta' [Sulfuricella denitrificans]BAN35348.1 DNA polymerase III subunit delta' [Sulfuricella denitrificans skB26]
MSTKATLPGALLLQGRGGIGKFNLAYTLAQALLCESPLDSGEACEHCGSCHWFKIGGHPDFRLLEPEAQSSAAESTGETAEQGKATDKKASQFITVAQIRELADFVNLTTHRNGMRIILAHPAEAMNVHAANALLKTLEEPPLGTLFILVSHQPQRLLPTVRSRCQKIDAPLPGRAEALKWLREQEVAEAEACLAQSGYAPLAALRLSAEDYQIKRRQILEQLGAPDRFDPLALAEQGDKMELAWILNWMQQWVYDLASIGMAGQARYQPESSAEMNRLAKAVNLIELFRFQQELLTAQRAVHHPLNTRLVLEQLFFSYWQLVNRQEAAYV